VALLPALLLPLPLQLLQGSWVVEVVALPLPLPLPLLQGSWVVEEVLLLLVLFSIFFCAFGLRLPLLLQK
jgi:hypothetical protein